MKWLARLYARRIVNVNVNIVAAGLLALPPLVLVVYLSQRLGLKPTDKIRVGPISFFTISAVTIAADLILDFTIYMVLHWLANHHPWRSRLFDKAEQLLLEPAHQGLSFIHDAGLIQFERAVLSPALYMVWIGLQSLLIHRGSSAEAATAIGAVCGIAFARALHTLWMLHQERRSKMERIRAIKAAGEKSATPSPADQSTPNRISPVR